MVTTFLWALFGAVAMGWVVFEIYCEWIRMLSPDSERAQLLLVMGTLKKVSR